VHWNKFTFRFQVTVPADSPKTGQCKWRWSFRFGDTRFHLCMCRFTFPNYNA